MNKFQKEYETLTLRKLSVFDRSNLNDSPQAIMNTIAKIFFKTFNEFTKCKMFSKHGYQQIQINVNYLKYFFRENLINDYESILDGYFIEIMKNCSWNTINPESFNDGVIYIVIF